MPVWLRVGPWSHGECRNGGFPDWLVKRRDIRLRSNDPAYLYLVGEYFDELAAQCRGMLCRDGGPVIGMQIENEYGHAGGPTDPKTGIPHMDMLKKMLVQRGFTVPYYTATGWGCAHLIPEQTLPVFGAYVDEPWAQHTHALPANKNFLILPESNDAGIAEDLSSGEVPSNSWEDYPYLMAELGGGLQVTSHRRPTVDPRDTEAQAFCALGSGANLLGYYMYHGGTNPDGRETTLQESRASGSPNDLPVKSYDFQAPIRENGMFSQAGMRLVKLHLFLHDFGALLAPARPIFVTHPQGPEDMSTPRICVRHNAEENCGFIFINDHQRNRRMQPVRDISVELCGKTRIKAENISVESGECALLPYNLPVGGGVLGWTNATLLCRIGSRYFFRCGGTPVYHMLSGEGRFVTLTADEANRIRRFGDRLYITDAVLFERGGVIYAASAKKEEPVTVYGEYGGPVSSVIHFSQPETSVRASLISRGGQSADYMLTLTYGGKCSEAFLSLPFDGDRAEVFLGGRLIADWFRYGETWRLALAGYGFPTRLTVRIYASRDGVYYDAPVKSGCALGEPALEAAQRVRLG
jgi:hypothetical protein